MLSALTPDHQALVARIDALAAGGIARRAAEYDVAGRFPDADFDELHREDLLLATLPRREGGLGFGFEGGEPLALYLVIERLARVSPATAHCYQVHCHALQILRAFGSDAQVARCIEPTVARGRLLVGAGSEPGGGRDGCKAVRVAGGYRVDGVKHYATNATRSDWMTVHLRASDTGALETIIVHRDNPGLEIDASVWDPAGMRACVSPLLRFRDCFIPDDCVLGGSGDFLGGKWLARINFGFTANYLGALQGIYDWTTAYVRERGRKEVETYQAHIGEMKARLDAARLLYYHAIGLTRTDLERGLLLSNEAKWLAIDCFERFVAVTGQVAGSTAYFRKFPLERMVRDMLVHTLHRRHHVGATIVGRCELGLDYDLNQS